MGFSAKLLILLPFTVPADEVGPDGEEECITWYNSRLTIDFGSITRLEKLTAAHFKHITFSPFDRAGIFMMDCFLSELFRGFEERPKERLAPEFLIRRSFLPDDTIEPTRKTGGVSYVDCSSFDLDVVGNLRDGEAVIANHNAVLRMGDQEFLDHLNTHNLYWCGPMLWASCAELAQWLTEAEEKQTEGWVALLKDEVSHAFVRGWRHQLFELGQVGARVLVRLS